MSEKLYPVVLLAYNRPDHTLQVLQALQKNLLADRSELFIFIDGTKAGATDEDIEKNRKVREVVAEEQWCGKVEVYASDQNRGCRLGPVFGISEVLKKYEAAIILEDDIVTSPFFLTYMNQALSYYRMFPGVFSVSGYNMPPSVLPIPDDYAYDAYVSLRQQNWGWGTWANRWQLIDWNKDFIPAFLQREHEKEAFNRGGDDLSIMLEDEYKECSDAWDIQFSFNQFKYHAVSIVPCHSYTNNIGLDQSGTHTLGKNRSGFENDLSLAPENPHLPDVLYEDKRIINAFYSVYHRRPRPLWQKIVNRISRMLGGTNVFTVKKKIYC